MLKQALLTLAFLLLWCGNALGVSLTLSSPVTGAGQPFTVGHAFARGDVPAGSTIVSTQLGTNFQAVIKNAWPDGSAKFAILSGLATLSPNTPLAIGLAPGVGSGGAALTTASLQAVGAVVNIGAGSFGSATWQGTDWTAPFAQWIAGLVMASWTYRKQIGSDAHLVGWLEVRLYANGLVEIVPWVENGYLRVAGPTSKSETFSFTLNGVVRYQGALTLPAHTRAVLTSGSTFAHWVGTAPQITFKHDTAYLQTTRLTPKYFAITSASSPIWNRSATRGNSFTPGLTQTYTPLAPADYHSPMPDTGYQSHIGPLPEWDAAYLTSAGDPRGFASVQVNAYAAGRYSTHFRDETTNRPLKMSSYSTLVMNQSEGYSHIGASTANNYTPTPGGTGADLFDIPHHPSIGFMAYLLTGRNYFLEEVQFVATANFIAQSDDRRQKTQGVMETIAGTNTTRGAAWAIRSLAQAAVATPDSDPLRTEFVNSVQSNVTYYYLRYVASPNNPFGIAEPYVNYNGSSPPYAHSMWMEHWLTWAFGYINELQLVDQTTQPQLDAFMRWKWPSTVGVFGGGAATEWCYRDAATQYTTDISPSATPDFSGGTGPWYASWGAMYLATTGFSSNTCNSSTALNGDASRDPANPESYWANLFPAIAYAVEQGASGALAGYSRMTGASNWAAALPPYNDMPVWSVTPRGGGGATPNPPRNLTLN